MLYSRAYQIVKRRYITEKSQVLLSLQDKQSNPSLKACETPKYVFLVDKNANKEEIARAVEEIYQGQGIKVIKVNTLNVKPKMRRVRGRVGAKNEYKKAVVTLRPGDRLDQS